jgi:hypothetical protein
MIAAFAAADQLRRRPAPVNTSMRRTGSGIGLCSEIDMCRSPRVGFEHHPSDGTPKGVAQTPLTSSSTNPAMKPKAAAICPAGYQDSRKIPDRPGVAAGAIKKPAEKCPTLRMIRS